MDLDLIREKLSRAGLACLPPNDGDDEPRIVEPWI
jgi:hypothetical protein